MRRFKKVLLVLVAVLLIIQFIQPAKNKSTQTTSTDIVKTIGITENAQTILLRACYDCHSNNTNYPWYSSIQPFGWLLANHIKKGKADLNFNEFGSYSLRRQISKLNGIANSVKDGTMPLNSYLIFHKNARLSQEDKAIVIKWATDKKDSLELIKSIEEK